MSHPGHIGIYGLTGSGKTVAARHLARGYKALGMRVIALDDDGEDFVECGVAEWQTTDPDKFLQYAKISRGMVLLIDEGPLTLGGFAGDNLWLTSASRKYGHLAIVISQRPTSLALSIRSQLSRIICYRVNKKDAKLIEEETDIEASKILALPQYEAIYWDAWTGQKRFKVENDE